MNWNQLAINSRAVMQKRARPFVEEKDGPLPIPSKRMRPTARMILDAFDTMVVIVQFEMSVP